MVLIRERRLFERIKAAITVRHNAQGSPVRYYSTTRDISGGGIKLEAHNEFKPGTLLEVEMFNEGAGVSAVCKGKVVWIAVKGPDGTYDMGVEFLDQSLLYIGRLIKDLIKDPDAPLFDEGL